MNRRLPRVLRDVISVATLAAFFSLPTESLIADVHDGHAVGSAATLAGAAAHAGDEDGSSGGRPDHDRHVDHCNHGHGLGLPSAAGFRLMTGDAAAAPCEPEASSAEFSPLPPHRPPID